MEKRFVMLNELVIQDNLVDGSFRRAVDLERIVGFYENDGGNVVVEIAGRVRIESGDIAQEQSIQIIHIKESFDEVAKLTML